MFNSPPSDSVPIRRYEWRPYSSNRGLNGACFWSSIRYSNVQFFAFRLCPGVISYNLLIYFVNSSRQSDAPVTPCLRPPLFQVMTSRSVKLYSKYKLTFKKMQLKPSSAKCWLFCLDLNALRCALYVRDAWIYKRYSNISPKLHIVPCL